MKRLQNTWFYTRMLVRSFFCGTHRQFVATPVRPNDLQWNLSHPPCGGLMEARSTTSAVHILCSFTYRRAVGKCSAGASRVLTVQGFRLGERICVIGLTATSSVSFSSPSGAFKVT